MNRLSQWSHHFCRYFVKQGCSLKSIVIFFPKSCQNLKKFQNLMIFHGKVYSVKP